MLFRKTPLAFCLRAVLLLALFGLVTLTPLYESAVADPLRRANAALTHGVLRALRVPAVRHGVYIQAADRAGFRIEVIDECTGASLVLILLALTLAFPASWKSRAISIAAGTLLIFLLNLARLVSLFLLGRDFPELFDRVHVFVWQGALILIIFVYWYVWAVRSGRAVGSPPTRSQALP